MSEMTPERKEYLKLYMRKWRKEKPEKAKEITKRYWKKKLENDEEKGESE